MKEKNITPPGFEVPHFFGFNAIGDIVIVNHTVEMIAGLPVDDLICARKFTYPFTVVLNMLWDTKIRLKNFEGFANAIKNLGFYWLLLNQPPA